MLTHKNTSLRKLVKVIGHEQSLMIVAELLLVGSISFNELRKKIALNPNSLDKYLKLLVEEKLIQKIDDKDDIRNWYSLTEKGKKFSKIFELLRQISK